MSIMKKYMQLFEDEIISPEDADKMDYDKNLSVAQKMFKAVKMVFDKISIEIALNEYDKPDIFCDADSREVNVRLDFEVTLDKLCMLQQSGLSNNYTINAYKSQIIIEFIISDAIINSM